MAEAAVHALWAAGRAKEATTVLVDARQQWQAMGATGDARRCTELFPALGLRRPSTDERPRTGWSALTATERQVAALVGTGAANATIAAELGISRRTVETHVRHLYAKLGLSTRVELALEVTRRGAGG